MLACLGLCCIFFYLASSSSFLDFCSSPFHFSLKTFGSVSPIFEARWHDVPQSHLGVSCKDPWKQEHIDSVWFKTSCLRFHTPVHTFPSGCIVVAAGLAGCSSRPPAGWALQSLQRVLQIPNRCFMSLWIWFCQISSTKVHHTLHSCQINISVCVFFSYCGLTYLVFPCRVWPALVLLLFPSTVAAEESSLLEGWNDVWLFRFLVNMLGYSTIIIPGYLLISYFKRTNYLETGLCQCDTDVFFSKVKELDVWSSFIHFYVFFFQAVGFASLS